MTPATYFVLQLMQYIKSFDKSLNTSSFWARIHQYRLTLTSFFDLILAQISLDPKATL